MNIPVAYTPRETLVHGKGSSGAVTRPRGRGHVVVGGQYSVVVLRGAGGGGSRAVVAAPDVSVDAFGSVVDAAVTQDEGGFRGVDQLKLGGGAVLGVGIGDLQLLRHCVGGGIDGLDRGG